jgi:peptide/nickel transport system substrate-binding protein
VAVVVPVAAVALVAGCTQSPPVDPQRAGTVVVAVDTPFASLNAGLPDGRTAGSALVLGLVQDGLVGLDEAGAAVPDPALGTVEKVADDPLTVRYTIAEGARWSDGVPVTPVDLLLEWAARSGQFDEAAPDEPAAEASAAESSAEPSSTASPPAAGSSSAAADEPSSASSGADSSSSSSPSDSSSSSAVPSSSAAASPSAADEPDVVRFGATSPALLAASATPTIDGQTLTLVYDHPVADWQAALDVDLPAHVVGRLALAATSSPAAPSASAAATESAAPPVESSAASAAPSASATSDDWAAAVADAIRQADRAALVRISQVWRTGWSAQALAADPSRAVTTGPYRITAVDPQGSVSLEKNDAYAGSRPAARDRIVVRWDLDPLAAIDALRDGQVDVVAPVSTPDVTEALDRVRGVQVGTGGGAVFQLVLNEAAGPFSAAGNGGDASAAAAARAAFVAAVPRTELATAAGAEPSDALLATVGPARTTRPPPGGCRPPAAVTPASVAPATDSAPASDSAASSDAATDSASATTDPGASSDAATASSAAPAAGTATASGSAPAGTVRPVRVLAATGDPARAAMLAALTAAASAAGFAVTAAAPADATTALWAEPAAWDAALIPVTQAELPVAGTVDRWRTGGATNVSGHADGTLDAVLDQAASTADPLAATQLLDQAAGAIRDAHAAVPLVRQPSVVATVDRPDGSGLPNVGTLPAVPWGDADLSSWWSWACGPAAG